MTQTTGQAGPANLGDTGQDWSDSVLHNVFEPMAKDTRVWIERIVIPLQEADANLQQAETRPIGDVRGLRYRAEQLEEQLGGLEVDAQEWSDDFQQGSHLTPLDRLRMLREKVRALDLKTRNVLEIAPAKAGRGTGGISGTVTDSGTGSPIQSVTVYIYYSTGNYVAGLSTDGSGNFATSATLDTGNYFASTYNYLGYVNEIYDNIPWDPSLSINFWTPISVTDGAITTGIDFALDAGGQVSGTVTDSVSTLPIESVQVDIRTASGSWITRGYSNASGVFATQSGLPAGTYFARAYDQSGAHYLSELYDDIPCYWGCDATAGTPITVAAGGANTTGIDFALDPGGTISGTVTDSGTAAPISSVWVAIYDHTGRLTDGYSDASGNYTASEGLPSGTYYAFASDGSGTHHINEIWDNIQCEANCDPTTGTPIVVTAGIDTLGIDFALEVGGSISGMVLDNATSLPVENAGINFYDGAGDYIANSYTDASGAYTSNVGMLAGDHFALAAVGYGGYLQVLYDDIDCAFGCDETTGTPIAVALGATTPNIDFNLVVGGTISGTITASSTSDPIENVWVNIYGSTGDWTTQASTDATGAYMTPATLPTGTYFAVTYNNEGFVNELFDDIDCSSGCDVTTGTPISVTEATDTPGIDFALDTGARISGTVTDDDTALGINNVRVRIYNSSGNSVTHGFSDATGDYVTNDTLDPGTYFARTWDFSGGHYLNELYDDLPCAIGCDVTTGTPIIVTAGTTIAGIDFGLAVGGAISGTITATGTSTPIGNIQVNVYVSSWNSVANGYTNSQGAFTTQPGLPPGTYFARTYNWDGYLEELYDDLPCSSGCDPITGTPITVTEGTTTEGINFALDLGSSISGTISAATGGTPIDDARARVYDASGNYLKDSNANSSGNYSLIGLPAGTYFLRTENWAGYFDELFDNMPCVSGDCHVVTGTPIVIGAGTDVTGIDFALEEGGQISGRVLDAATRMPIADLRAIEEGEVWLFDESGTLLAWTTIDGTGYYSFSDLTNGSYFVRTYNWEGYDDELYDNIPCESGCDVTTGTPVVVIGGSITSDIDFALDGPLLFSDGFESGDLNAWSGVV